MILQAPYLNRTELILNNRVEYTEFAGARHLQGIDCMIIAEVLQKPLLSV